MMLIINLLVLIISIMISIAFFTLMERKVIGLSQNRKGPNKTSLIGILQPISDAVKLAGKEINLNYKSNLLVYWICPLINLVCSLMLWMIMPLKFEFNFMKMSSLFMFSCMAVNIISLMMMSWSSNSNYALVSMMRMISQLISYEINLMLIVITIINLTNQMSFHMMSKVQSHMPFLLMLAPMMSMWFIVILAETNRTPFDFSEGESELVSGFNIEFSGGLFMLLFLSEYSSILAMAVVSTLMFTSYSPTSPKFYFIYFSTCFCFIWSRTTLPRFRYDKLMKLSWTQIMPLATYILFLSFIIKLTCAMKS